jgi:hypothetical protein
MIEVETGISENGFTQISSAKIALSDKNLITQNAYAVFMKMQNKSDE